MFSFRPLCGLSSWSQLSCKPVKLCGIINWNPVAFQRWIPTELQACLQLYGNREQRTQLGQEMMDVPLTPLEEGSMCFKLHNTPTHSSLSLSSYFSTSNPAQHPHILLVITISSFSLLHCGGRNTQHICYCKGKYKL